METPKTGLQNITPPSQFKLPSISDIYNATDMTVLQKDSAIQVLLNQEPKPEWNKEHPTVKVKDSKGNYVPLKYMPIERVEWLLTILFLRWRVEIRDSKMIANSVVVTVRVHYYDHALGEWNWTDGIGAAPIQIDSGNGAIDFAKMKFAAIQMAAPSAESYAVKDACEKLGKIFGKDLNRQTVIDYAPLADRYKKALENE